MAESTHPSAEDTAKYYVEDPENSFRHFTEEGYAKLGKLIGLMKVEGSNTREEFYRITERWMEETRHRIARNIFGNTQQCDEELKGAANEIFATLSTTRVMNDIQRWSDFTARFQNGLRRYYKKMRRESEREANVVSLDDDVPYNHLLSRKATMDEEESDAVRGVEKVPLHETISSDCRDASEIDDLRAAIEEALGRLKDRESLIIRQRFELDEATRSDDTRNTLQKLGEKHNVTQERIRQITEKAVQRLGQPRHAQALAPFLFK